MKTSPLGLKWILLLPMFFIAINSCKKDKVETPIINEPVTLSLTADKQSVNQLEIVSLKSKNITFSKSSYSGTIGANSVTLKVLNDSLLAFMMPTIAAGSQTLSINIESKDYSISFNVLQPQQISNPTTYINDFVTQLNVGASDPEIQDSLNYAMQQFNNLTPEQQQEAVAYIAANRQILDEVNAILTEHNLKSVNSTCSADLDDTEYMKCIVADYIICVIKLQTPVVAGALLGSTFTPIGTFIGGMVGVMISNTLLKKTLKRSNELWVEITNHTFRTTEVLVGESKSSSYNNNVAKSVVLTTKICNIQNITYSQSWLNNLISKFNLFTNMWNTLLGNENPPSFAVYQEETGIADNFNFISVKIINNSNVTGDVSGTVDNMEVTFSTTQTTEQTFSFSLTYNDGDFNVSSIPISAVLTPTVQQPYSIEIVSGNNQTATPGQQLTNPIKVIIKNEAGSPFNGAKVNFTANNGGSVSQTQVTTGADGTASVNWTLGNTDNTQTINVTAYKSDNTTPLQGSPLTFTATGSCTTFMVGGYEAVQIGTQVWMAKNMSGGGVCYNNDPAMCAIYGSLYTWTEAIAVCPIGWHLPSDAEWNIMEKYLDSTVDTTVTDWGCFGSDINSILRETGTNSSCFSALLGGYRYYDGSFYGVGTSGNWWTATQSDASNAWKRELSNSQGGICHSSTFKTYGYSVRCVKD